jgi:hypothetical protein
MKKMMLVMTLFCFLLIGLASAACAVDVSLQWDAVIHPDLAGYNVYQSEAQGNSSTAWAAIGTTAPGVTVFSVTLPDELKTYTWTVTAFSTQGEESRVSNPVSRFKTGIFQFAPQNLTK